MKTKSPADKIADLNDEIIVLMYERMWTPSQKQADWDSLNGRILSMVAERDRLLALPGGIFSEKVLDKVKEEGVRLAGDVEKDS
jgi:hypothetical protein